MSVALRPCQLYRFCGGCEKFQVSADRVQAPLYDVKGVKVETVARLLLECTRCHMVYYCSDACRTKDLSAHQVDCIESSSAKNVELGKLLKTIQILFPQTILYYTPDLVSESYGRLCIEVKEGATDETYPVKDSRIRHDTRRLIKDEIEMIGRNSKLSHRKGEIPYLEQLERLTQAHPSRYMIYVTAGETPVGNFQFQIGRE